MLISQCVLHVELEQRSERRRERQSTKSYPRVKEEVVTSRQVTVLQGSA